MKKLIHKELLTIGNQCFVSYLEKKNGLKPEEKANKSIISIPHLTLRKATVQTSGKGRQKRKEEMADFSKIIGEVFLYSAPALPELNPAGNAGKQHTQRTPHAAGRPFEAENEPSQGVSNVIPHNCLKPC